MAVWRSAEVVLFNVEEDDPRPIEAIEAEQDELRWLEDRAQRVAISNAGNRHRVTAEVPGVIRAGAAAFFRAS